MAYPTNPYLRDEYGGAVDDWGQWEGGGDSYEEPAVQQPIRATGGIPEYPTIAPKPMEPTVIHPGAGYSAYEAAKARMTAGGAAPTDANKFGSRPFFIPSGAGGAVARYPGMTERGGTTVMSAPTIGPMPEFKLPLWDEKKIESKAQRAAGPGLRELRKGMREAQGRYYENPNVRRMTLRDAMAGYGMGLEKVLGGARREAVAEYGAEYAPQVAKAQAEFGGQVNTMLAQYQNAWKEYLSRMQTVTG